MAKHSPHQQRAIRNYYQNRDALAMQRLGEQVTDLFLAEGKAREQLWRQVTATLKKLKVTDKRIEHIVQSDDPTLLAELLKQLLDED